MRIMRKLALIVLLFAASATAETVRYYNSSGKMIARSESRPFGGQNYYDRSGRKIGYSTPRSFGGWNYYDKSGRRVGYSSPSVWTSRK